MRQRVALVTGAGRGIGRAAALLLAERGARVALTSRSEGELQEVAAAIEAQGGEARVLPADLTQPAAPAQLLEEIERHWAPVEILVNNAGVGSSQNPKPLVDFDDDFWDLTMLVNVRVPYLLTKAVLPEMLRAGWGRIVNIASINAKVAALHGAAYAASKHALAGLTKATAREVAARGITANAVCPGVTATRMNDLRIQYDSQRLGKSFEELEAQSTPLGRRLTPDEVAQAVVFLASPAAAGINGQLLNVCGGTVMS